MSRYPDQMMARQAKFMGALRTAGMPDQFYQKPIDDVEFREWLVEQVKEKLGLNYEETVTQRAARELMGNNFLGIPEFERHFGELTKAQRKKAEVIPEKIMTDIRAMSSKMRSKHILEYNTGISSLDLCSKVYEGLFLSQSWSSDDEFLGRTEAACWRLICKTPADDRFSKERSE